MTSGTIRLWCLPDRQIYHSGKAVKWIWAQLWRQERGRQAGGWGGEEQKEGRMDSNLSYVIHLHVYPRINTWEMTGFFIAVINHNYGLKVAKACWVHLQQMDPWGALNHKTIITDYFYDSIWIRNTTHRSVQARALRVLLIKFPYSSSNEAVCVLFSS